ncbi:N-acetylmuramoyl-L-alanine amidase [Cohnella sp. CFH 77786]|uniref:N-acetylmuramoyl-L-alanine amidase n=1 Tax=Cohnella sp. CFH 77786 TaxID=2662265 RepID=UPI001C60E9C1|nr:N-acetylmuramoyl-L-alanine amidase [Cohnella sp. CFH 77786]
MPESGQYAVQDRFTQMKANTRTVPIQDLYLPAQNSKQRAGKVTHVMVHFISNAAEKPQNPYDLNDVYQLFVKTKVSAHYMIGRNGEIYRLVSEDRVAYHAGQGNLPGFPEYRNHLNEHSIGIELLAIGTSDEMQSMMPLAKYGTIAQTNIGFTDAQYRSLNRLLNAILSRHPAIQRDRKHIVGHNEYAPGRKKDPGKLFDWSRVQVSPAAGGIHTVQKGESLWLIARKYGTSVQSLAKWNRIDPNVDLYVGQQLKIP